MSDDMIQVTLNGKKKEIPAGLSVAGLLDRLKLRKDTAIVEHNLEILKQRQHGDAQIADGDTLEIVRFVGGG